MIFTTSWDDGHPLDMRVADLLSRYGFQGTFYLPMANREGLPVLAAAEIRSLAQAFEIGSHTKDHCYLASVRAVEAQRQIAEGKDQLEQLLGHHVGGFCYPGGHSAPMHRQMVLEAGFAYARTGASFHRALPADAFAMPTTLQFYPHTRSALLRNLVTHGEWPRRLSMVGSAMRYGDFLARVQGLFDRVCLTGGLFHLWGHAWELEAFDGWRQLERFLAYAGERVPPNDRMTNYQVFWTLAQSSLKAGFSGRSAL